MASSGSVGTLSWSAKLDSNEFKKGVRKVKKQMKEAQKSVTDSLKTMSKGFTIATGAVVGLTGALAYMTKQSAEVVNAQKILADSIGATQSEIAGMELVADSLGVSYDQLIDKMREFGGIDEFKKLADQVASAETATEQMAIAQKALGNEGLKLLPVLQQGADGLKAMEEEALKLGLALPDDKVNALTSAWGAFEKAMQMVRGLTRQLSAELGESFGKTFVLIQSIIETFRGNFISMFSDINKGYVSFINLVTTGVQNHLIPAFVSFQSVIGDVGNAIALLFNLFASSTVGTTIDNWTLSLWDFMSAFKESISLGFVKLFQKVFEAWNKSIIWAMEKLNKLNEIAQDFLVKIGAKSKIEGIISIGTDKGRLKAYKDSFKEVNNEIKEIQGYLEDDLERVLGDRIEQVTEMQKSFKFSMDKNERTRLKAFEGVNGEDGKQGAIKVEVEEKTGGTLATAGSIEEFNLLRDQRNQELIESKKQTKLLEKIVKSPMKSAGF